MGIDVCAYQASQQAKQSSSRRSRGQVKNRSGNEVAGLPAEVAGLPAEVAGLPAEVAGLPAEVAGLPGARRSGGLQGGPQQVAGGQGRTRGMRRLWNVTKNLGRARATDYREDYKGTREDYREDYFYLGEDYREDYREDYFSIGRADEFIIFIEVESFGQFPASRPRLPDCRPRLPGCRPRLPDCRPRLPGCRPRLPDCRPRLPASRLCTHTEH
jgi:hypothetical protein